MIATAPIYPPPGLLGERGSAPWGERPVTHPAKLRPVDDSSDLVVRFRAGDAAAFRELFRAHREDVARLVRRLGAPTAEVEDLVQEVFVQVHRSIGDFRGHSRFSTWLYRLTVNVTLMHRRATKSRPVLIEEEAAAPARTLDPTPDEQVDRRMRIAAFYRILGHLSEKKRTVFVLHDLEGLAPSEIARVVGAPVLTVRTRLFYARRDLIQMMSEEPVLREVVASYGKGRNLMHGALEKEST